MIVGFVVGLFRMLVDTPVTLGLDKFPTWVGDLYAEGSFLWIVNHIFFQYFSVLITIVSIVVMIVVSYMTKTPSYEHIKGLTYGTATAEDSRVTRESWHPIDLVDIGLHTALHHRRLSILYRGSVFRRELVEFHLSLRNCSANVKNQKIKAPGEYTRGFFTFNTQSISNMQGRVHENGIPICN